MHTINSYLQNNGFDIDMTLSNERYSYYNINGEVGKVDNKLDFITLNGVNLKLIKLISKLHECTIHEAYSISNLFTPLISIKLNFTPFEDEDKSSIDSLNNLLDSRDDLIATLQTRLKMIDIHQKTGGIYGTWYLSNEDITNDFINSTKYLMKLDKAVLFDSKHGTDDEIKYMPKLIKERKANILKSVRTQLKNLYKIHKDELSID